jgi:DNA-binding NarL/FixJ family response regulator
MKRAAPDRSQPSLDDLRQATRRAEFSDTARALDEMLAKRSPSAEGALLRARIALRLRKPAEALEFVTRHGGLFSNAAACGEAVLIAGAAYARLGDERAASAQFKRAAAFVPEHEPLRATLLYERALAAWIARKLDAAEKLLAELARLDPAGDTLIEARVLQSVVAASRENLTEQGALLLDALHLVHAQSNPPVLHWAVIASQIAYLAREMPSRALRDAAFAELTRVPWTSDLADYRFTMLRAVGWRSALEGDYFNAFRRLKDARAVAPTDAWRVMSSCDRAYFATVLGERRWAEQELSDAHELAASVPWVTLDGEERFALSVLAELFAPRDPALALSYVAKYKDAGSRFARTLASHDDRRVGAMESYSFGIVQKALGETEEAVRLLRDAWKVYDRIGYDWRAGRAALVLAGITGDDAWKERAARKLQGYERSWLAGAKGASAFPVPPQAVALTPARRAVYEQLLRGLSTAQIAAEQQRSEFTIRNHVKAIFKAFGVTSRPALIARAIGTSTRGEAG